MKKLLVLCLVLINLNVQAEEPRQCQKGILGELGRLVAGAIISEGVHQAAEHVINRPDRTPTPRPEPVRNNDRGGHNGSDPSPVAHPGPNS